MAGHGSSGWARTLLGKKAGMLRSLGWFVLVVGVGVGVHFTLQGIIQSGDAEKRKGPDLAKVARLEAADPVHGAKVRAGMEKYESICRLCHHRTGQGGKFTPPIAGREAIYIETMLKLYRSGTHLGPMTNLMAPWARELSDQDISNLAAYVETL
jgi:cytochrome c553